MESEAPQSDWDYRIQVVRQELEARLDEDIPLAELAELAHASMFHFHRVFRGVTGETLRGYVRRLRLERAALRLRRGAADILQLALDSGYESHEAFSRAFKGEFGLSPSDYRARAQDGAPEQPCHPTPLKLDLEIRARPAQRIAYVRHTGAYSDAGACWAALMKWGWSRMLFGRPETFGLCFDDPDITEGHQLRYEACMAIGRRGRPKGRVNMREQPGGTYAVAVHQGSFQEIGRTYARLCARIVQGEIDGRRWALADPPSLEVYLADPRSTPEAEMRTEIWMPVAPLSAASSA